MAEELQGLLEKIHQEGIKKADDEKAKIISDAKEEAEKIINKAKEESEAIRKKAEEDAANTEKRAKATIQQAARDIVLSLRAELETRLREVVKGGIGEAMTPDLMIKILTEMVKNYLSKGSDAAPSIEVLLCRDDLEKMDAMFKGSLIAGLKTKPDLSLGHDLSAGLKVNFKGDDVFFDFSDEAIADIICSYTGPKLAEYFKAAE
jgi:V/A-type H+-transporting ATPase subunit E